MIPPWLLCILLAAFVPCLEVSGYTTALPVSSDIKVAILITIAGRKKLSDYFDWTCTSIERGKGMFDLIVFHEGNEAIFQREKRGTCASNVKFINLGEHGLSRMIGRIIVMHPSLPRTVHIYCTIFFHVYIHTYMHTYKCA